MLKWKLMLTTLPYVVIVLGAKIVLDQYGFVGAIDFGDIGAILTAGVFVIGFMLAGTMADFKEAEKIPADLACAIETIDDTFSQACASASKPEKLNQKALLESIAACTDAIYQWLCGAQSQDQMYQSIEKVLKVAHTFELAGVPGPLTSRVVNEASVLRKIVTRIGVISRTDFLATGYALLEILVALVIGLLLVAKYKAIVPEYLLISCVTFVYVYMVRFIKDIDNPFEYSSSGRQENAGEVALFPLQEYRKRLARKIEQLG